jgi:hypothetical protein
MSLSIGVSLSRRLLAVLIVSLLTGLTPLAYTDPPDPLWISGYWDDDDFDNVVVALVDSCAIQVPAPASSGPSLEPVALIEPPVPAAVLPLFRSVVDSRAPPIVRPRAS